VIVGSVTALVARIGVPNTNDLQLEPGSIAEGLVLLSAIDHKANDNGPVAGIGWITVRGEEVHFAGRFDFALPVGSLGYAIVKHEAAEMQWSLAVNIEEEEDRILDDRTIRIVKRCRPVEVSPVLRGACRDTYTISLDGVAVPSRSALAVESAVTTHGGKINGE
jgi:hypothetical protein